MKQVIPRIIILTEAMTKFIPSIFTSINLICGFIALIIGDHYVGSLLLLFAVGFDVIDGLAARALNAQSEIGKELDSLADLVSFGLVIEDFGGSAVCVRETPALLGQVNAVALVNDIADELADLNQTQSVKDKLEAILSRVACFGSIRSGRTMRVEEMNALLSEMEVTPHSGQCNHGRPTYVELKLRDIEKLFGRR